MNLNAYDDVTPINKNWISPRYKKFYSKTLPKYDFFTILKRYNKSESTTDYYLVLCNDTIPDKICCSIIHNPGYDKFDLTRFWKDLPIRGNKDIEVYLELEEEHEDYLVYYISI